MVGEGFGAFVGGVVNVLVGNGFGAFVGGGVGVLDGKGFGAFVCGEVGVMVGDIFGAFVGERVGVLVGNRVGDVLVQFSLRACIVTDIWLNFRKLSNTPERTCGVSVGLWFTSRSENNMCKP